MLIRTRGIMDFDDIDDEEEIDENICSLFSPQELRKFLMNFMKMIQKKMTIDQVAKEGNVSVEETEDILETVTKICKDAPKVEGKTQGIKFKQIFINSSWVDKIAQFNFNRV